MKTQTASIAKTLIAEAFMEGTSEEEILDMLLNDHRVLIKEDLIRVALKKQIKDVGRSLSRSAKSAQTELFQCDHHSRTDNRGNSLKSQFDRM